MVFTVERLEIFILMLVRISAFMVTAPFFSSNNIPRRLKVAIAFFLSLVTYSMVEYESATIAYEGTIGLALLMASETVVGLTIGYIANICMLILNFAGHMIDVEIGFSMASLMDPMTRIQTTVTANYYTYLVMLMMLVTNMHYFLIRAIVDSARVVPFGMARLLGGRLHEVVIQFMSEYFIIGFRIILPVFSCILVVNVVLGILAKIAPQMNMFVVGMQMKVFAGLCILYVIVGMIPAVSDFVFEEMRKMIVVVTEALAP